MRQPDPLKPLSVAVSVLSAWLAFASLRAAVAPGPSLAAASPSGPAGNCSAALILLSADSLRLPPEGCRAP